MESNWKNKTDDLIKHAMLEKLPIAFEPWEVVDEHPCVGKLTEGHHHEIWFSLSTEEFSPLSIQKQN